VLRCYSGIRSRSKIDYEHKVVSLLHQAGWPVAAPLRAPDGRTVVVDEGRHYTLFPRLPGRTGKSKRPPDPHALGRLLARLHFDLQAIAEQIIAPPPPAVFPPVLWTVFDPIWEGLADLPDPALGAAARRAVARLAEDVASVDASTIPSGIVHGEWSAGQILYLGGQVAGVLDFDFVHPDLLAVDLGIATVHTDVAASVEIVAGYRAERELSAAEVAVIGMARRAVRIGYMWPSVNAVVNGDATGCEGIRLQLRKHDEAEETWTTLLAAIT